MGPGSEVPGWPPGLRTGRPRARAALGAGPALPSLVPIWSFPPGLNMVHFIFFRMVPIWSILSFGYFAKKDHAEMDQIGTTKTTMMTTATGDDIWILCYKTELNEIVRSAMIDKD